jgi:3-oxoacyl-[acyl-carrier protein] reductase
MTRALSDAVSGDGILINTICPGLTNTQRARDLQGGKAAEEGCSVEEILDRIGRRLPAGRLAEPEEIANMVVFLASEPCSYLFGSSLYMDGGGRRGIP